MVGRANPEAGLRLFVQLPDGECRHDSNDSIASYDCKWGLRNIADVPGWGRWLPGRAVSRPLPKVLIDEVLTSTIRFVPSPERLR